MNYTKFKSKIKYFKYILLILFFFFAPSFADAASRFWVGGSGNWSDNTNHWSATSGGSAGASKPTTGDTAILDGSSGGGTVTVDEAVTTDSITMGAFTGTLNMNGQTFTLNNMSVTGTGTRTLTMGASTINLSASSGSCWNAGTITNLTISSNTATITCSGGTVTFTAGAINYNGTSIVLSGAGTQTFNGASTFANFTRIGTGSKIDALSLSSDFTVTGILTLSGNSVTGRLLVQSSTVGTTRTITNTGATETVSNTDFLDVAFSEATTITTSTGDCGGNSGATFTTATTRYWIGGTGNWDDTAEWSTSSGGSGGASVPLCHDDVVFDNGSFSGTSQTVDTNGMPRLGKSIDWSAYTEAQSPGWTLDNTGLSINVFGSINIANGGTSVIGTYNQGGNLNFRGRSSYTLTTGGESINAAVQMNAPSGTLTLQDALSMSNQFILLAGTFDANDFNFTATAFTGSGSLTRVLNMGNGTWTLTTTGTIWSWTTSGATLNEETSTITVSNTTATSKTFTGSGETYYNLTITGNNVTLTGSNNFNNLSLDTAGLGISTKFTAGTTQRVYDFSSNGSAGSLAAASSTASSAAYIEKIGPGDICEDYLELEWINVSPASTWYAGANSTDRGNNTQWSFTACPTESNPNTGARNGPPNEKVRGGFKVRGGLKFR